MLHQIRNRDSILTSRLGIDALNHRARICSSYLEYGDHLQMYDALEWINIYYRWLKKDGNICLRIESSEEARRHSKTA